MFKLGESALLGSKKIAYEKHPRSIIILKMVNDLLRVWKENHSITVFRCYFSINKGHDHILLVDDKRVTEAT